ncbi:hypothetical protein [Streptomyces fragilis]|uniref:Secreted protein n=1 Tax=Streptomyces fragilis TaxID=67301 RepID=A0ABV2YR68_9ACTN|nr:hypothetical protein [Streptomyces fragilis]
MAAFALPLLTSGLNTGVAHAATCVLEENVLQQDKLGNVFRTDVKCENLAGNVYGRAAYDAPLTGKKTSTLSTFVCWTRGERHSGGNTVWYYTKGDTAVSPFETFEGWGAMESHRLLLPSGISHPFPGLPRCPWY